MSFAKNPTKYAALIVATTVITMLTTVSSEGSQLSKKPDWLITCPKENPNQNDCFRKMFEGMFPALAKGIPEMGVKHFEPLQIDDVSISKGSGNLVLAGGFKRLLVRGPSNATVGAASLDLTKNEMSFDLLLPRLRIDGTYDLNGNMFLLPVVGSGKVAMTLKNVKSSVRTKISIQPLSEDAIHIETMQVTFLIGGMRIHLSNLFNGNQLLGSTINNYLNVNSKDVIEELRPDLERGLSGIFKGLWNNVFEKMPIKYWLV